MYGFNNFLISFHLKKQKSVKFIDSFKKVNNAVLSLFQ